MFFSKRVSILGVLLATGFLTTAALAQTAEPNAAAMVDRVQAAARTLSFSGTFVHQQDSLLHTSRITQARDAKQTITRVQALDGHRHEVVKIDDETRIYLPERQVVKVERTAQPRAAFPAMFVGPSASIARNYDIVRGATMRIANTDAQELLFKPKHGARWAVRVWVDKRTSLIVKCQKLDAEGNAVEQAAFTDLNWSRQPATALSTSFADAKSWAEFDATMQPMANAPALRFKTETLKGFEPLGVYERATKGAEAKVPEAVDMRRYVLTDGIALVSVFVQPTPARNAVLERPKRRGAMAIVSRELQGAWVTVIGDVPPETLQQFAQTIEWK